ncbi:MAG TPA: PIG-L family deacetylase [Acidimicrobiales bacterium]|nr:PIG-L family deacetylase [Acidimicrobiales bacterium]
MATLVCFHAHPDDEAIATGGTMAKAAADGHRVVLVTATRGEHGEVAEGFLDPGEELWQRREQELGDAAKALGVARYEFLGYVDSGMMGVPENDVPGCFWQAEVDQAARRLADILEEEQADVLTVYDDTGGYGHPDHIQVYRVGVRAAEMARTPKVYESTLDNDYIKSLWAMADELGMPLPDDLGDPEEFTMGKPASEITTRVDVAGFLDQKRQAMAAHASQISETSFFLNMPPPAFAAIWGLECYILRGAPAGTAETSVFEGLA